MPRHVEYGEVYVVFRKLLNLETYSRRRLERGCLRKQKHSVADTLQYGLATGSTIFVFTITFSRMKVMRVIFTNERRYTLELYPAPSGTLCKRVPRLFMIHYPYPWPGTRFFRPAYPEVRVPEYPGTRTTHKAVFGLKSGHKHRKERRKRT